MVNERQGDGPPEDVKWLRPRFRLSDCFTVSPTKSNDCFDKRSFCQSEWGTIAQKSRTRYAAVLAPSSCCFTPSGLVLQDGGLLVGREGRLIFVLEND